MSPNNIIEKKIDELNKNLKEIKNISKKFPKQKKLQFHARDLKNDKKVKKILDEKLSNNTKNVIYIFEISNINLKKLHNCFDKFSTTNKKLSKTDTRRINLSKHNKEHNSNYLYVGSKRKNFKRRIKEHIGTNNNRTFAMHLKDWVPKLPAMKIKIIYYTFNNKIKNEEVLQIIEDAYWDYCMPILGKKGHN